MMADHDDVRVWVKFLMQPSGQVSHWNMQAIGKRAEFYLPHFPNIQQAEIQAAYGCRIWPGSLQIACQVVDGNLKLHTAPEYIEGALTRNIRVAIHRVQHIHKGIGLDMHRPLKRAINVSNGDQHQRDDRTERQNQNKVQAGCSRCR